MGEEQWGRNQGHCWRKRRRLTVEQRASTHTAWIKRKKIEKNQPSVRKERGRDEKKEKDPRDRKSAIFTFLSPHRPLG
jgi:hypothetical protein